MSGIKRVKQIRVENCPSSINGRVQMWPQSYANLENASKIKTGLGKDGWSLVRNWDRNVTHLQRQFGRTRVLRIFFARKVDAWKD